MCCGMEAFSAKMYHVLKSAEGDFNQGNVALFVDTAGKKMCMQCITFIVLVNCRKSFHLEVI